VHDGEGTVATDPDGHVTVGRRCYVGNLSFRTTWQDLKDHFRQVGNVVYTKVLTDESSGQSKGCGIVEFEAPDQALRAIRELHDKEFHGRLLTVREDREDFDLRPGGKATTGSKPSLGKGFVRPPQPGFAVVDAAKRLRMHGNSGGGAGQSRRCYVGNLSYRTSWQDLKDHFRTVGNVVYTGVMEDSPGHSKGCGIVEFETPAEAARAISSLHDSELNGRQIFVREDREDKELNDSRPQGRAAGAGRGAGGFSSPAVSTTAGHRKTEPTQHGSVQSKRCYVGNLSYRTSWQDLKDHFRQAGTVIYSSVMEEPGTGRSKGCGLVEFSTPTEAAKAIEELHDSELKGRLIFVREDREERRTS